jgi:hypothetical protein
MWGGKAAVVSCWEEGAVVMVMVMVMVIIMIAMDHRLDRHPQPHHAPHPAGPESCGAAGFTIYYQ